MRTGLLLVLAAVLVSSCGGGDRPDDTASVPVVRARLTESGILIECAASRESSVPLSRDLGTSSERIDVDCPGVRMLDGDFRASRFGVASRGELHAMELSPPRLIRAGTRSVVLSRPDVDLFAGATLEAVDASGAVSASLRSPEDEFDTPSAASGTDIAWRWRVDTPVGTLVSQAAPAIAFSRRDTGYRGAVVVGSLDPMREGRLLGDSGSAATSGYGAAGLPSLGDDRELRDIRIVDLDNDGRPDLISNVYGRGCTQIEFHEADGRWTRMVPARADGSCLGGNGETLLVADFDGDGRVDILVPSYQRFDYLRNLGDRQFVEEAASRGVEFKDYLPKVEGAAVADIDFDGDVDVVIASEILKNDGTGHFARVPAPYGAGGLFDEGLSVADLDADGRFDIAKHHPELGPRVFWGEAQDFSFEDAGWVLGGEPLLHASYGVAAGALTGGPLQDLVLAGGVPAGSPSRLCVQRLRRHFDCRQDILEAVPEAFQDLLLVTDLDGAGQQALVSRAQTLHVHTRAPEGHFTFRFDLRDAAGRRTQYGRSLRAVCAVDGRSLGAQAVDGGNGFLAQGDYPVLFRHEWCPSIFVDVAERGGMRRFGPFAAGLHRIVAAD